MNLLVKFPTRSRRAKFLQVLSIYQRTKHLDSTKFLITCDTNDRDMNTPSARSIMSLWGNMTVVFGESHGKIHACNRDLNEHQEHWDICLLASDDMIPQSNGWDKTIVSDMEKYFPDTDGVLFYSDGFTPLNTLVCVGRKYYERFGYLYNPEYKSLWCDNEFMEVADKLQRQVFIRNPIIRHEHYSNGFGTMDKLMMETEKFYLRDKQVFERRKAVNFNL